jgi:hypothetical protein
VDCTLCQRLESELGRLERLHAEKMGILRTNAGRVRRGEYSLLRIAESDVRLDLESVRVALRQHKGGHGEAH